MNPPEPESRDASGDTSYATAPVDFADRAALPFPIVGVGASAGGLEAVRQLLDALPAAPGMAFVVVQHLPPDRESLMADIFARHTQMPVRQVEQGMSVEVNVVYVSRPGFTITLNGGAFQLGEPVEKRGHRRPVDDFYRSLAATQRERSIIVVLSGMGTNGTAGAQAVKAAGGLCIAQSPESAEFPSMPMSLIHAGYADRVLPPAEIGPTLVQYVTHLHLKPGEKGPLSTQELLQRERQHLGEVFAMLRTRTGHDFSGYKKPTVLRRIHRRMGLVPVDSLAKYAELLRQNPSEVKALANDLMINVTGFFRDAQSWEALREAIIQPLVAGWNSQEPIRAWVTACASGEEAYTLAMVLAEEIQKSGKRIDVKIFATDTADKSLALARSGVYPGGIEGDISLERLDRFFERDDHAYRLRKNIREMVVFAPQDLLRDPPFSRVDICSCRNLLIYLEPEVQERVLGLLHFSLRDNGSLFLGSAETLGAMRELYETVSPKHRIYRKLAGLGHRHADLPPFAARLPPAPQRPETQAPQPRSSTVFALQQALFEQFGPPTVIADQDDRIVYFHGDTTPFLVQPLGEPTRDLYEVLNVSLRPLVRDAHRRALAEKASVTLDAGEIESGGEPFRVFITVAALLAMRTPGFVRVSFELRSPRENTAPAQLAQVVPLRPGIRLPRHEKDNVLEDELRTARHELQSTVEAFESSTEELKASNEEVISINEELQSANEELETSKEELQSLNEELITVNGQLQAKIVEIEAANNDLSNLWSSTSIAVVFLDTQFRVRRFTPAMHDLLSLLPTDIGRPIDHFAPKFTDGDLIQEARKVLATLVPTESEARSHSGAWYMRRTLPYRTADNHIDGIVITFIDITARKRAEQAVDAAQTRLQSVIEQMPAAMLMVDHNGRLIYGNRLAASLFGHPFPLPFVGTEWAGAAVAFKGMHEDGRPYSPEEWPLARTLAQGITIRDEEVQFGRSDGSRGTLAVSASPIIGKNAETTGAVATFWDISDRKQLEVALRESEQRFRLLVENATDYAIFMVGLDGRIASWNSGAERLLGWAEQEAVGRPVTILLTPEDRALGVADRELRAALEQDHANQDRAHVRKDGSRFWGSGTLTAVHDSTGKVCGFAKVVRDHTELRRAQEALQTSLRTSEELRRAAEAANRAKDEFISTVSHELRTPLNTIRLWSRLFASGKMSPEETQSGVEAIERAAKAQQALIDDLLDVSRMASGKLRLNLRDVRLVEVVRNAIDAVRPAAESRSIQLQATLDEDVGVVRVDPDRVQQVVWNLLSNAVKFTPSGGEVGVELHRVDSEIEIVVRDNGIGIRPEFLPHVFDRFRQAERIATRQHTGLGLGLAIARQLIELHRGSIKAFSEGEGHGAVFTIRLPSPRRSAADVVPEHRAGDRDNRQLSDLDVLVVEDDLASGEAIRRLLEVAGAKVRTAASAIGARDALALKRPDLMVCDIGLPGEDGYELVRSIRTQERNETLPRLLAIAATAFAAEDDRRRALEAGFDQHVAKPIDPQRLVETIAKLSTEEHH
jgi:two-component system, chemotaxis family, CheB/CheR fusion protein